MAPILIDGRDLLKLGFVSVLVIALVFVAGFFIGHQQAEAFYRAGSEVRPLPLPEKVMLAENLLDSRVPEIIEAGEDIDVDQPDAAVSASPVRLKTTAQHSKPDLASKKSIPGNAQAYPVVSNNHINKKTAGSAETPTVRSFTSVDLNKIKYSIQVGMYGRLANAENMMKRLQAQRYEAYVSDYTNKKNEVRYNVRFGYFFDKKSAIAGLNKFKEEQKGDGYLVNFSADNIVNVARATDIAPVVDVPVQKNKNKNEKVSAPVITPGDSTTDKVSRTELFQVDLSRADFFLEDALSNVRMTAD